MNSSTFQLPPADASHMAILPKGEMNGATSAAASHGLSSSITAAQAQAAAQKHWGLSLSADQQLMAAGSQGPLWRIAEGWLALIEPDGEGNPLVQLAGPGDVVGIAALSGDMYRETGVALTPARATPELWSHESTRLLLMHTVMAQQQRQARDMTRLRTGSVQGRLRHLIAMLAAGSGLLSRKALPQLRDLARIIDAAPATVCRELGRLFPEATTATRYSQRNACVA